MTLRLYDVVIIGGGQAGIPLAFDLAAAGQRVALAERKQLGGSCVNFGCTPTKAAIASAKLAHQARRAQEYGLRIPSVDVDFGAVLDRARALATRSRDYLTQRLEASKNPALLEGHASFEGRDGELFRVRVGDQTVLARQVVLDTGTRSLIPPVPGLEAIDYLHASNWLDRPELPGHLAILGGGYIGLEMGQMYRRFGSEVTLIEQGTQIAGHEDEDVAEAIQAILESEGIRFLLRTGVRRVEALPGGVTLELTGPDDARLEATHLFLATARKPNTDALALETVGLEANERGLIAVDERLATKVPGVWAVGDIRGGPMFTHTAWDDYRIVLSQLADDGRRTTDRVVPYALFTDPELGRVGMTEQQARQAGKSVRIGRFELKDNGKARELGETQGFIKVIVEADTHQILGAAVLAAEGAELVHLYVDLMNAKAPYQVLENAVHIHPTLAEAVQSAVSDLPAPQGGAPARSLPNVRPVKKREASPQVRALFEEIQDAMGIPWVPANWSSYAMYPAVLQLFWERLKPAVVTERFLKDALAITERAYRDVSAWYRPGFEPHLSGHDRSRMGWELDAFEFGNPQILVQQAVLSRILKGETVGGAAGDEAARRHSAYREPAIDMVEEYQASPSVQRLYRDLKQELGLPLVNSDYKALAKWPEFFAQVWQDTKVWRERDEYAAMQRELATLADQAALRLPAPVRIARHELSALMTADELENLEKMVPMFSALLPGLILNVAMVRVALSAGAPIQPPPFEGAIAPP